MVCAGLGGRGKKRVTPASGDDSGRELRYAYISIFNAWGRLPDEIGRQIPRNVFYLLNNLGDEGPEIKDLPSEAQKYYGLD